MNEKTHFQLEMQCVTYNITYKYNKHNRKYKYSEIFGSFNCNANNIETKTYSHDGCRGCS